MRTTRIVLLLLATAVLAGGPLACGGHDAHDGQGGGAMLGAPAKGGLDVRGNALFVALGKTGEVAVVDVDAWKIAGKVKVASGFYPHHLGLSPDRTRVAVAAPGVDLSGGHGEHGATGALFLMDTRSGDVLAQRTVSGPAHNLAYLPDGGALVYTLAEHGTLRFADPVTLADVDAVAVGLDPLEASPLPGGKVILVANSRGGTVSVVDTASRQVTKTLNVGSKPIGAWIGAGGTYAYVTSEFDRKFSIIDLGTMSVKLTVYLSGIPGQAMTTADGAEIWVTYQDKGTVAVLAGGTARPITEIAIGQRPHGLALSADGRSVFVTEEDGGRVHEVDVAGRVVRRSLDVGGTPNGIVFRPPL